jgi:hypothetical protein
VDNFRNHGHYIDPITFINFGLTPPFQQAFITTTKFTFYPSSIHNPEKQEERYFSSPANLPYDLPKVEQKKVWNDHFGM